MRLSDRYIFAELMVPFFIGTLAVLMMLVGNTLFSYLSQMLRSAGRSAWWCGRSF
jgi:lipopolysaccharide export LptBFGC system permease protein LptF